MRTNLLIILIIILCSCGRKSTNEIHSTNSVLKVDLLSEPGSMVKKLADSLNETDNPVLVVVTPKNINAD